MGQLSEPEIRARLEQALPYHGWYSKIEDMLIWFSPALSAAERLCPPFSLRDFSDKSWNPGAHEWVTEAGLLELAQQMQLVRRDLAANRMIELWANPPYEMPENLGEFSYDTFETSPAFTAALNMFDTYPFVSLVHPTQQVGPAHVLYRASEILSQKPELLDSTRKGYYSSWQSRWVATDLPADQYKWAAVHLAAFQRLDAEKLQARTEQSPVIDLTKTSEWPPETQRSWLRKAGIYEQACQAWLTRYELALRWWEGNSETAILLALAQARRAIEEAD